MINLESLKSSVDMVAMAEAVTDLRKKGAKEYTGPCPFCGGRDRFNVQADKWLCRNCTEGKWQDVLSFIARRDNLDLKADFHEIVKRAGGDPGQYTQRTRPSRPAYEPPLGDWQASALEVIEYTRAQLWQPIGEKARGWLGKRGLKAETVERYGLGFSTGETIEGLYIPAGIVIPCIVRGRVWYIKIRTRSNKPGQKYTGVKGNRTAAIFGADTLAMTETALFCEGEFDAMLADQEIGDVITPVTLGSATNAPDLATWGGYLARLKLALLAYDQDQAGSKGAAAMAELLGNRARFAPLPKITGMTGKDLTDFYQAGGNLWEWIRFYLMEYDPLPEGSLMDFAKSDLQVRL